MDFILILGPAFFICLLLTGIHCYLGLHVLARNIIFVDLALAQAAAFGLAISLLMGWEAGLFKKLSHCFIQCFSGFIVVHSYSFKKISNIPGGFYRHCVCFFFRSRNFTF